MVSQTSAARPADSSKSAYAAGSATASCRSTPSSGGRQRGDSASSRSSRCDGEPKLPGTWKASQPSVGQRRCPVPQQLEMTGHPLQYGIAEHDVRVRGHDPSALRRRQRRTFGRWLYSRARAIISGEESSPSTMALGHRSARVAVRFPGPQPRSTTRRGDSAAIRPTRSKNGRPRSSPYRAYASGSHCIPNTPTS